tara:strand:- start:508 stop:1005 length:498 start_codon:yes stop_codon:yes gene_type:complete
MSFWKDNKVEPLRTFRFKILDTSGKDSVWWWVKTVEQPTAEIDSNQYQLLNHEFNYPGIVRWRPITVTLVDPGGDNDQTSRLYNFLKVAGYGTPDVNVNTLSKTGLDGKDQTFVFQQLKPNGEKKLQWQLEGAFISRIDFGRFDYSSDELVELSMTITYDFAKIL